MTAGLIVLKALDVTVATNEQLDAVNGSQAVSLRSGGRWIDERRERAVRERRTSYSAGTQ